MNSHPIIASWSKQGCCCSANLTKSLFNFTFQKYFVYFLWIKVSCTCNQLFLSLIPQNLSEERAEIKRNVYLLSASRAALCCFHTTKWCLSGLSASQAEDVITAASLLWSSSVSTCYPIAPLSLEQLHHHSTESLRKRAAGHEAWAYVTNIVIVCHEVVVVVLIGRSMYTHLINAGGENADPC